MNKAVTFTLSFIACWLCTDIAHAQSDDMKRIPAGHYIRGRHKSIEKVFNYDHTYIRWHELQPHMVRLTKPFYISSHEVTVGEFREFVEATGYETTAEKSDANAVGFKHVESEYSPAHKNPFSPGEEVSWENPGFEQTDDHPVVCVSWKDAVEYCKWLSEKEETKYRLPTEAEWEFACRGGNNPSAFYWGNDYRGVIHERVNLANVELENAYEDLGIRHWFIDVERDTGDGHVFTSPVGTFPANPFGLHDMHGNVWEWCHDTYVETTYREYRSNDNRVAGKMAVDPVSEEPWNEFGDWRIIRGGSWYNNPATCRSDVREYYDSNESACYLGFRVARDAPEPELQVAQEQWQLEQQATEKALALVEKFVPFGPGNVERSAYFRGTPSPDDTRDLHRISFLTGVTFDRIDPESIPHIAKMKSLKELKIHNADGLSDEDLAPIANMNPLRSLIIPWGQSELTSSCIKYLAGQTDLKSLELNGSAITDEGLNQIRGLRNLTSLRLVATGTKGGILSSLGNVPLRSLGLADLSDEHAVRLTELRELNGLTSRGPSLTGEGFAHFAGLKQLTNLDLRSSTGIAPGDFAPLRSLTKLTSLDLNDTHAGDEAMRHLSALHQLSYFAASQEVTDEGLIRICDAISLDTLKLPSAKLTDAGFRDMWRMQRLVTLRIESRDAKITGEGFGPLAEAKQLRNLTIRSSSLTDRGLGMISIFPRLETLVIGSHEGGPAALTDEGLLKLGDLEHLRHLAIGIKDTQITDDGIEKLKAVKGELRVNVTR